MNKNFYQRAMQSLQAQNQNRYSHLGGNGNGGMGSGSLTGPERVFGLRATSTTNAASDAILFGYARHGVEASAGSGSGIAITGVGNIAHGEMKTLTAFNPYELLELRLRANAEATIMASITVSYREAGGSKLVEYEIYPILSQTSGTDLATRAEVDVSGIPLDASTRFVASIAANGWVDFLFISRQRIKVSDVFEGKSPVSRNDSAVVSGPVQRLVVENKGLVR